MTENHNKKISAKKSLRPDLKELHSLKQIFYKFLRSFGLQISSKENADLPKFQKNKSRTLRKLKILLKQEFVGPKPRKKSKIAQFDKIEVESPQYQTSTQEAAIAPTKQTSQINSGFWKEKSELAINMTEAEANKNLSNEAGVISKSLPKNSIGEILKEARTATGLTVEKVSQNLRVSAKDILALEDDEIERISKNIYTIGFIHSYGRLLQVDSKLIESKLREIDWQSNTKNKVYNLVNIGKSFDLKPSGDVFLKFLLASSAAFILALFIFSKIEDKSANISTDRITAELQKIQLAKEANQ